MPLLFLFTHSALYIGGTGKRQVWLEQWGRWESGGRTEWTGLLGAILGLSGYIKDYIFYIKYNWKPLKSFRYYNKMLLCLQKIPLFQYFIMNIFKVTKIFKEFYSKHPYTTHWVYNLHLLDLLYHLWVHLVILLCIQSTLFSYAFQSKLQSSIHFTLNTSPCISLTGVQYLFIFFFPPNDHF